MDNGFLGGVAVALGAGVQYLRARKGFPEWAAWCIIAVLGVAGYWLATEHANLADRAFWRSAIMWVFATAGVTQGASSLANSGAAFVPKTDSK